MGTSRGEGKAKHSQVELVVCYFLCIDGLMDLFFVPY